MPKSNAALGGGVNPASLPKVPPATDVPAQTVTVSQAATSQYQVPDSTGITVVGKLADMMRLVAQFGVPNLMICVLIMLFTYGAIAFKNTLTTLLDKNSERDERRYQEQREDHRDDRRQEWRKMENLADAVNKLANTSTQSNAQFIESVKGNSETISNAARDIIKSNNATNKSLERQSLILDKLEKLIDKRMP